MNVMRLGWTLVHFCWQGALIAAVYAVARSVLNCGARLRYGLACAALAAMLAAPSITWWVMAQPDEQAVAADFTARVPGHISAAVTPLPDAATTVPTREQQPWLRWTVAIWLLGVSVLSARLIGGWILSMRMRWKFTRPAPLEWIQTLDRLRAGIGLSRAVGLRISALLPSPAVIGALRPLVLLPVGMLTGLPEEQVEALLLHELAHIQRHDYLVNLLQSVAEALLFYHPAVWWVSSHIRAERERCCDDMAVAAGGDVLTYVNALAELESSRRVPLAAVAASGGSLTDRIARLLGESHPATGNGLARGTVLGVLLLLGAVYGAFGQSENRPSFQVASVKLNTANPQRHTLRPQPGGRLTTENAFLQQLIQVAYGIQAYQLIGGPAWMTADGFDIEAKPEAETNQAQMLLMLQSLLADRFKLALHRETRELPVYSLTAAKGGLSLPAPKDDGCVAMGTPGAPAGSFPCGFIRVGLSGSADGRKVNMSQLVGTLAGVVGRPVIDNTGYNGVFDFHLTFAPDPITQGLPGGALSPNLPASDPAHPGIFDALQEQLGLKLSNSKGPVEVLVIDHVERPSAN